MGAGQPGSGVLGTVLAYPLCNVAADSVGDMVEDTQDAVMTRVGYTVQKRIDDGAVHFNNTLDDLTEDAFKSVCVGAWYQVGKILNQDYLTPRLLALLGGRVGGTAHRSRVLIQAAGTLIALSIPSKHYDNCYKYGDFLGDVVEGWGLF